MKFNDEELMKMATLSCPECGGKSFTSTDSTFTVGRCMECNTLVESFGVVPALAAQLLEERKNNTRDTMMSDETYDRIQTVGPWIAGITSFVGIAALFLL
jgi:DNA-directed RNA polymerase subunit RPC12/RpoP